VLNFSQLFIGRGNIQLIMSSNVELRLKHLEDNIKKDQNLLKDYEDTLRYEDDPRRKAKYTREITQLRESAELYQKEYDELLKYVNGRPTAQMQSVEIELKQVHKKLDKLSTGQKFIYENINHLRQGLLNYYKVSERNVIEAISDKLDQSQIKTISAVLDSVKANQLPEVEMLQIVGVTQQVIDKLEQRGILPSNQQAAIELIKAPEIDTKHRFKIFLPIIPILLSYEGELELGSGINLKAVWQNLLMRFQGE